MKKQLPFIIGSLALFAVISLIYFYPVLSGNMIFQQDIMQYKGGAEELTQYRKTFGKETYWTDSMFSGMPTYQSGARFGSDILQYVDKAFGLFLPRPVNYFFMMFAGFFLLGMVWLKNWKYALTGALFFGLSTYFFQITEAGHNSKVHTLVYFAPFLAGLWLLYEKKYWIGFFLSTLALSLQLHSNHPQMTFYLMVCLFAFGVYKLYFTLKNKEWKSFGISSALLALCFALSVGMNAASLLSTYQYSKESTRGPSELVKEDGNNTYNGLDRDYITDWSYGIVETFNLMIPNFYGGGNNEKGFETPNFDAAQKSLERKFYRQADPLLQEAKQLEGKLQQNPENEELQQQYMQVVAQLQQMQSEIFSEVNGFQGSYWGEQPFTSGPAYVGSIVVLLALFSLFWIKQPYKWWLLGATMLSFFMAWGKNFPAFTNFMIDHFPFYNKFRAVSSAMVVAELTIPALAMLGIYQFLQKGNEEEENQKKKSIFIIGGGIILLLFVFYSFGNSILPFHSSNEKANMSASILEAIEKDRFAFFKKDILRTSLFIGLALVLLYSYNIKLIKNSMVLLGIIALLSTIDLWSVDKRYLNKDSFVSAKYMQHPFPTEVSEGMQADMQKQPGLQRIFALAPLNKILKELKEKDKTIYRVFNRTMDLVSENNTSYFHQSLGGYHGAKLGRYNDVLDAYLRTNVNGEVVNMLNAKYVIEGSPSEPQSKVNFNANGNAWFVSHVKEAQNPNEEFDFLKSFNSKKATIVPKDSNIPAQFELDSTATIQLDTYQPNKLYYTSRSKTQQFGVFSEIYYPYGWTATIDGKEAEIIKANYLLRGLVIPEGSHKIVFEFQPLIVEQGEMAQLFSFIIFLLLSGIGLFYFDNERFRSRNKLKSVD